MEGLCWGFYVFSNSTYSEIFEYGLFGQQTYFFLEELIIYIRLLFICSFVLRFFLLIFQYYLVVREYSGEVRFLRLRGDGVSGRGQFVVVFRQERLRVFVYSSIFGREIVIFLIFRGRVLRRLSGGFNFRRDIRQIVWCFFIRESWEISFRSQLFSFFIILVVQFKIFQV